VVSDPERPFETLSLSEFTTADSNGTELSDALVRVQSTVREYPGVDDIVYEYRRAFQFDPLVARHGEAYYLLVPPHVWPEYATAADLSEHELAACRRVHDRVFHAVIADAETADYEPLVLVRS
jgi:hypothetical protein